MIRLTSDPKDLRSVVSQKGSREYLLCQGCESRLSLWEKHASDVLRRVDSSQPLDGIIHLRNEVDYTKFKLFLNSMIWRISISSLDEFNQVRIKTCSEKFLWESLQNNNPGTPDDNLCIIRKVRQSGDYDPRDTLIPPILSSIPKCLEIRLVIFGLDFKWIYPMKRYDGMPSASLSLNGDLLVGEVESSEFVDKYRYKAVAEAINNNPKVRAAWNRGISTKPRIS